MALGLPSERVPATDACRSDGSVACRVRRRRKFEGRNNSRKYLKEVGPTRLSAGGGPCFQGFREEAELFSLSSAHHIYEIAAGLHADCSWLAELTAGVWQCLRQNMASGRPGACSWPISLGGPLGAGRGCGRAETEHLRQSSRSGAFPCGNYLHLAPAGLSIGSPRRGVSDAFGAF